MSTRDRLTLAAALAVALATSALQPLYEDLGWLLRVLGAVVAVAGTTTLVRLVGLPRVLQPVAGVLGVCAYAAAVFAGDTLAYGLLPTTQTLVSLAATLGQGMVDVEQLAAPVPTSPGLVLLAVLGTGAVAVVVDTLAVVVRKAAVAGLPLLALFAVPSAVLAGGVGLVPFVLGAAGWLGLLLADSSDQVSRWGTPLRSSRTAGADPSLGRVGRRIGAAALGVAVIVPALIPGLDNRVLGGSGGTGVGGSRTTTTYNPILKLAGQLRLPDAEPLFTYTSVGTPDYVRLTTLDVFDPDGGWSSSELSGDVKRDGVQDGVPSPVGRTTATEDVSLEIELEGTLAGPWLPVPAVPDEIDIDGPWLWDEEAETVFSTRTSLSEVDEPYTVRGSRVRPSVDLLRRPQTVPSKISETYAVAPQLSSTVRELLDATTADAPTAYDKVAALQNLFAGPDSEFVYSEDSSVPGANSPDALENFLTGKRGFCEQYASAMGALVRGLGIPARVAVGFTSGSPVGTDRYLVTTSEAHAWPEVWFEDAGWVRFEPTPRRAAGVNAPLYSVPPVDEGPSDAPSSAPSSAPAVPEDTGSTAPDAADRAAQDGVTGSTGDDASRLSPALLAVPALLLLLALPALIAAVRRRRRWRSPDAEAAWQSVQDDAVDVGHTWRPVDSPRTAAAHLLASRRLPADAAAALERLALGAERARYARESRSAEAAALRQDAHRVRDGLRETASGRDRWQARLAPPSTLRWVSGTVGTGVADALDRLDAAVSAAGARLRHPRTRARRAG